MTYVRRMFLCGLILAILAGCGDEGLEIAPEPIPTDNTTGAVSENPTEPIPTLVPEDVEPTPTPAEILGDEPVFPMFLDDPYQQGGDIFSLQDRLAQLGYLADDQITGMYDPATEEAVRFFQTQHDLEIDGVVGELTWGALFADTARPFEEVGQPDIHLGKIVYLAADGHTLRAASRDGSQDEPFISLPLEGVGVTSIDASPDGRFFAVTFEDGQLYVYYADGQLLSTYGGMSRLKWSPSGDRFMVSSSYEDGDLLLPVINIFDTEHDEFGLVMDTPALAGAWSSDGTWVALARDGGTLIKRNVQTSEETFIQVLGEDWYIQDVLLTELDNVVYIYAGRINDLGATGNGMQWWSVPIVETEECQQSATNCGEPVAETEPSGNFVDDFAYNPQFGVLAYSENVRGNACISYQQAMLWQMMSLEDLPAMAAPMPLELSETGGVTTKGITWLGVESAIAFAYQPYECTDTEIVDGIPQVFVWNINDENSVQSIAEGSHPIWLP